MEDLLSLAEAAELLGVAPGALRAQAVSGRLKARLFGKTWVTTRPEVERYRRDDLGQFGRPIDAAETGDEAKTDMSAVGDDGQVFGG